MFGRRRKSIVRGETVTPLMLDDAIHRALGPAATLEQWQLAGDTLHVADPGSRDSAALAAEAVAATEEKGAE